MTFDALILGGGPAGAATAIALAREGHSATIVERLHEPAARVGESLPPVARVPLEALGLLERFLADGHEPAVGNRSYWGSANADEIHFIHNAYGAGWHLDRRRFESMLLDEATRAGVVLRRGVELDAAGFDGNSWSFRIGAETIAARFAVDATGRASALARICGTERISIDQLVGVTAFFTGDCDDRFTLIEASEDGWWYSAALPAARFVVAYMTDADLAARADVRDTAGWLAQLTKAPATHARIANLQLAAPPRIASANTSRLTSVRGPAWLAVGDAAVSFDPLSSQGIDTALASGLEAARTITHHLGGDRDATTRYAEAITKIYTDYLVDRARYYAVERRWPSSPFWRRRQLHKAH